MSGETDDGRGGSDPRCDGRTLVADGGEPAAEVDPDALLDRLIAVGAIREDDDGALSVTPELHDSLDLYEQSYGDIPEGKFVEAVADAFGLDADEAERRIDEEGVTREEFVAYLALRSLFEDADEPVPDPVERASMAAIVTRIDPASPVPPTMPELDDDGVEAFLADHDEAVVFVWKLRCDPCERMKEELDESLAAVPEGVAVAGVDGMRVSGFRREFDVGAAPAVVCVRDGEAVAVEEGYQSPEAIAALVDGAFGAA